MEFEFDLTLRLTEVIFMPDIVDTAINAGTFNTLVTAITTAGLDTALKGPDLSRFLRQPTKLFLNCHPVRLNHC